LLALRSPATRPRRATNHRLATIAARGIAIAHVAVPLTTPQSRYSCQVAVMPIVRSEETAIVTSATSITRRMPKRTMSAAANGDPIP